MPEVKMSCACGKTKASARALTQNVSNRVKCYCRDCQAFAHYLDYADRALDPHGGTDITQMSQARFRITEGVENVSAIRLSNKGIARWRTTCCNSPIGNTLPSAALPFIGIVSTFFDDDVTPVIGPVSGHVNIDDAIDPPPELSPLRGLSLFAVYAKLIWWRVKGDHKKTSLFDPETGAPISEFKILTDNERDQLYRQF